MGNKSEVTFADYCYQHNVVSIYVSSKSINLGNYYFELITDGIDGDDVVGIFELNAIETSRVMGEYPKGYPTPDDAGSTLAPYKIKATLVRRYKDIAVFRLENNYYFRVQESF